MAFELNPQQLDATKKAEAWWKSQDRQCFQVSGPAGSGKTTIVYELIKKMGLKADEVLFMAYVGKAAMALAMKGNFAKTIHSSIYTLADIPRTDELGLPIISNGRTLTSKRFVKKDQLPRNIKLLVVDEGSMPDKNIGRDILSFGLPVLVLGDLNQLPPVFGEPFFLRNPDVVLTQIMRQAENNPIIYLSQLAIQGKDIPLGKYGTSEVFPQSEITNDILTSADTIICGRNETRQNINDYYRHEILGHHRNIPIYGEKIICRQNNWKTSIDDNLFLINGLIGYIQDIHLETYNKKSIQIDFRPEFLQDKMFHKVAIDFEYLFQPLTQQSKMSFYNKFQYAYAITCHLAQGSQYDDVLIYNENVGSKSYRRKWLYTAITRGVQRIGLAV